MQTVRLEMWKTVFHFSRQSADQVEEKVYWTVFCFFLGGGGGCHKLREKESAHHCDKISLYLLATKLCEIQNQEDLSVLRLTLSCLQKAQLNYGSKTLKW